MHKRVTLFALLAGAVIGCAETKGNSAQDDIADIASTLPSLAGWVEAVAIVRNLDQQVETLRAATGYEVINRSGSEPIGHWGLDGVETARSALLREPESDRGFIRLVELPKGTATREGRSASGFADTGGIMGLNVRTEDLNAAFDRMQGQGWRAYSDPVAFDVEEFSVVEAIFQGDDGLTIGLIERARPPLSQDWTMSGADLSRPNNAFIRTSDLDLSLSFYVDTLGWDVFLRDRGQAAKAGPNIYGWPHDYVETVSRDVAWVHPAPELSGSEGSVALIALGVEGRDFSDRSGPPYPGWAALRFWDEDDRYPNSETNAKPVSLPPYGCVTFASLQSPEGVSLEILTPSNACE